MFMIFLLTVALIVGIVWFINKDKEKEGYSELARPRPLPEKDGVSKEDANSNQNR